MQFAIEQSEWDKAAKAAWVLAGLEGEKNKKTAESVAGTIEQVAEMLRDDKP